MPHTILLVDDEKDIVDSLSARLAKDGFNVVTAFDGHEALAKANETNPDVVILDLMLPGLDGFEVLKEIKLSRKDKWTPVIIMSGRGEMESMKKGYALEADHYLTKPCTFEDIKRGIQTMLSLLPLYNKTP